MGRVSYYAIRKKNLLTNFTVLTYFKYNLDTKFKYKYL